MKKKINLIVKESNKNMRIDVFINSKENEISRTRIKNLILSKKLKINNKVISDPAKKVLKAVSYTHLTLPTIVGV